MSTGLKLGGIAALLLAGVFYTFALCVVEDVDEDVVMPEYLYVGEVYPDETEEAPQENAAGAASDTVRTAAESKPAETEITEKISIPKLPDKEIRSYQSEVENLAVPAMAIVTASDGDDEDGGEDIPDEDSRDSENAEDNYYEDDEDLDCDDDTSETFEQEVYGGDSSPNDTLLIDDGVDDPIAEPLANVNIPDITGDIFITIDTGGNTDNSSESGNSQSVGGSAAAQTFTAKFNGSTQTVNAYDLVCWIVNNEISDSFSDEAIKAQAVAAYSYVKYHNDKGLTPSVLVKKNPSNRIQSLVSSVWGVCCYYNGSAAETVYMASSSGYTADAANVWGGSVPYLKSVACPFDAQSDPNYGVTMSVTESDMRSMLESSLGVTLSDNPRNWIKITAYIDGNYVSNVNIDNQKNISGRKMRESVFGYKLKSASFDVSYSDGVFTFTTYGYGHGVGMSQNGANILAKQGYTYAEILKYYFTGIEVA